MINFQFNEIVPRDKDAWKSYKVSEEDDLKRVEIVNQAYVEGQYSFAAIVSALVASLACLAQSSPITFSNDLQSMSLVQLIMLGAIFIALYSVVMFIYTHKRRVKIIESVSSMTARLQIRSVISIRTDTDVYMFGESGISFSKNKTF